MIDETAKRIELADVFDLIDAWVKQQSAVASFKVEYAAEKNVWVRLEVTRGGSQAGSKGDE